MLQESASARKTKSVREGLHNAQYSAWNERTHVHSHTTSGMVYHRLSFPKRHAQEITDWADFVHVNRIAWLSSNRNQLHSLFKILITYLPSTLSRYKTATGNHLITMKLTSKRTYCDQAARPCRCFSTFTVSAPNARIPSASFSVPQASSFSIQRNVASSRGTVLSAPKTALLSGSSLRGRGSEEFFSASRNCIQRKSHARQNEIRCSDTQTMYNITSAEQSNATL